MFNGLRRSLISLPKSMNKGMKYNMNNIISRSLVDLKEKEVGEETIYIRKVEASRKKALEDKMSEILQRHHEDEEKQALMQLLDKKEKTVDPREIGLVKYLGFDDWRWALPVSAVIATPLINAEVIVIDYKMSLAAVFALMWHTYGAVILPIWNEKTDWVNEYIRDAWIEFDKDAVQQINHDIKLNEDFLQSKVAFQEIFAGIDEVAVAQATALNLQSKNEFHRSIQKKLDALTALNTKTIATVRSDLVDYVQEDVLEKFLEDEDLQEDALDSAITALCNGEREDDVVAEEYIESIRDYRDFLEDPDHRIYSLAEDLEEQIAEIVEAPEVHSNAGNVYHTHPVF